MIDVETLAAELLREYVGKLLAEVEAWKNPIIVTAWEEAHDPLFGPFRYRSAETHRGRCFRCGEFIEAGQGIEKERGGTHWFEHKVCPASIVKRMQKKVRT